MSELCETCGGHGVLMRKEPLTPEALDTLRPRAKARAEREGFTWGWLPCPTCDGHDRVTSLIESQAESRFGGVAP